MPSNSSSAVSRQYDRWSARTVNASTSDWSTRRLRMSTSGLTVTRVPSPIAAAVPVEHRLGAGAGSARAGDRAERHREHRPCPGPSGDDRRWSLAPAVAHPGAGGRPGRPPGAAGRSRARRRRRPRWSMVRWRSVAEQRREHEDGRAGSTASTAEPSRNAAQSATQAATHTAMHAPSTKPGSAGAGATTSPNCVHASAEVLRGRA